MKTLRFLILGLLATVTVCHAQNNQAGWFNVQSLSRSPITVIDTNTIAQIQGMVHPLGLPLQPNVPSYPIAEAITPEIQALADGLQDDPLKIYKYVHDHINYLFYFGAKKGAQLTLLEKSGNDFDQCALLTALLNAAGYTNTQYQFGWVLYPYDIPDGTDRDLHHWLQLTLTNSSSTWTTTSNYLAQFIFYRGFPTYAAFFGNNVFSFQHVWVTLTSGSTTNVLDPSFKVYEPVAGINLSSAMGFSSNAISSAAGGTDTSTYVTGLNESAVRSTLAGYTTTLLGYLQANYPNASSQQILGGQRIVPATDTVLPTNFIFSTYDFGGVLPTLSWNYEPTNIMSRLAITFAGTNYTWFMPQFQGQRLSLTYDTNGLAQLWQDDTLLAQHSTTASDTNVVLFAHHPVGNWNATNNTFIDNGAYDQTTTNTYQRTNATYALLYAFEPDWSWLQERQNQLDTYRQQGLPDNSRQIVSETLNIMGLNWMLQTEGSQALLCQQLNILPQNLHRLGRMAQESGKGYYVDAYMEEDSDWEASGLDAISQDHYAREFELKNYFNSALESGIIEQLQNTNLSAASTIKMLELASTNGQAVFIASYYTWSSITGSLTGYSTNALNSIYNNYILQGSYVMLPQNGSNHLAGTGSWAGYGYLALGNTMAMIISGGYSGGYSTYPGSTPDPNWIVITGDNQPEYYDSTPTSTPNPPTADPLDTADATFQLENTDLSVGQAEPRGVALSRYYNGTRRYSNPCGMTGGWIHNYSVNANTIAAPQAGLGGSTPAQMAAMLVASCASINYYGDSVADPKNWMVTALIAKWGTDQLTKSGVSVNIGKDTLQFVKQPSGVFTPPASCTATLTQSGAAYSLSQRHGNTYQFDTIGRLTNIVDQYSAPMPLTYTASNWVNTIKDWKNRTFTFTYSGTPARLTSVSDGTRTVNYGYSTTYNAQGDLTSFQDAEGKTTTYVYDTNHQITATLDAQSRLVVSNIYNSQGRITTQYTQGDTNKSWRIFWSGWQTTEYDPANGERDYIYDDVGRLVSVIDELHNETDTFYDGQNHITNTVSPLSETNQFVYDGNNNLIQIIDPLNHISKFTYNTQNNLIYSVDSLGNTNNFGYNTQFSLTGATNGAGDFVNYVFNSDGTLHTRADFAGTTSFAYDSNGQMNGVTYPNSLGSESFANSYTGDVTNHVDGLGAVASFAYNNRRQLTNSIQNSGTSTNIVTKFAYDSIGNMILSVDGNGNAIGNTWGATRLLLSTTMPTTAQGVPIITNIYDNRDWLIRRYDPLLNPTQLTSDAAGRLVSISDPVSRTTLFGYDSDSRKIATQNAAGELTQQQWDARGKLTKLTDNAGHTILRAYDGVGNQTTLTNRNTNVWAFQYDSANRLTNTTSPLGRIFEKSFNHQGFLQSSKDPAGRTANYNYDAKGRLVNSTDSVSTISYGYDANDNRTAALENGNSNTWTFDAFNRVSSYKDIYGNVIGYHYDANNNLTNLVYPGGRNVYYAFDSNNRLIQVTDWSGRVTTMTYDLAGRLTTIVRPNGTKRILGYDAAGQSTNIVEETARGFPIALFAYSWNTAAEMQWEFGAPLPHTNTPSTRIMTYDMDNQLDTVNTHNVTVDSNGNLASGPLTNDAFAAYTYDARNRLLNVGGVTNTYDALNSRVGQFYGTNTISYIVSPNVKMSQVIMRIKNGVTTYYIYGAGLLYQITETMIATNTATYHYDFRGSAVALTDDNGDVTDRVEYSPYGSITYRLGTTDTPFLFVARYGIMTDPNGLLYMRARYYNPYVCRFINPDPMGFSGGLNFYSYANGNPISLTDASGKWAGADDLAFTGGGAVIGAVSQGVSDLIKWHWSGLKEYGYAAAAGAAAGEATLYTGPILGAAAGAAAKNVLDQSSEMAATGNDFNYTQLVGKTALGAGTAYVAGFIPMPEVLGLNAGKGSFEAVSEQVVTKLENGTIQNISWSTAGKIFVSETYGDLSAGAVDGSVDGVIGRVFGKPEGAGENGSSGKNGTTSNGKPPHE